jgi:hypothetical protein
VSRIERGHLDGMPLRVIRRVAAVLEIRVELQPRSRAADLERLVSARHSALAESILAWFARLPDWLARPEVSFNVFGDRGVVDILAWHAATRSLLIIELKTAIVDIGELLGTLDRKRRRAMDIAEQFGWRPATVSVWLVVAESTTNRRRLAEHRATFRAALPQTAGRLGPGFSTRPGSYEPWLPGQIVSPGRLGQVWPRPDGSGAPFDQRPEHDSSSIARADGAVRGANNGRT